MFFIWNIHFRVIGVLVCFIANPKMNFHFRVCCSYFLLVLSFILTAYFMIFKSPSLQIRFWHTTGRFIVLFILLHIIFMIYNQSIQTIFILFNSSINKEPLPLPWLFLSTRIAKPSSSSLKVNAHPLIFYLLRSVNNVLSLIRLLNTKQSIVWKLNFSGYSVFQSWYNTSFSCNDEQLYQLSHI
jgi:hypothetical protein